LKIRPRTYIQEVAYDRENWARLKALRGRAKDLLAALESAGIGGIVHGSVARGDVKRTSDVDVFIPYQIPSYQVELAVSGPFGIAKRELVQATSWHLIKAHVYLDEATAVTFPLVKPGRTELEFYYFGGALDLEGLEAEKRVPGVSKELLLIEPTPEGHRASSIIGREGEVARLLDVSVDIVKERVDVLGRRDEIGRTGVYLKHSLAKDEVFEEVLKGIAEKDSALRRRVGDDFPKKR